MSHSLTATVSTPDMPGGIPYINVNDVAELFIFYGLRAILVIFMTQYLMSSDGQLATLPDEDATSYFHLFTATAYFLPLLGAIIADAFWGKYKTIISLSLVYCAGHFSLFLDDTQIGLFLGLTLVAVGSRGIKPCVASNVGDQFGKTNKHLLSRAYSWYYLGINLGSSTSSLLTPWLLEHFGPAVAFGVPGAFMALATLTFGQAAGNLSIFRQQARGICRTSPARRPAVVASIGDLCSGCGFLVPV